MLCGPVLGSLLYAAGGFSLPFYVAGLLLLILALVVFCIVPSNIEINGISAGPERTSSTDEINAT